MPRVSSTPWSINGLLRDLAALGRHPAVIAIGEAGIVPWESAALAEKAQRLAHRLRHIGVSKGAAVALWAPNSPLWVVAALAVLGAGGVLLPIDDLADAEQLRAALGCCPVRLLFTTQAHLEACHDILSGRGIRAIPLDGAARDGADWHSLAGKEAADLPAVAGDEPALLSWTSGTTGSPKAFRLTHRNIAANVEALRDLGAVGAEDRALLPLPLHHAYPFVVGMLTTLTVGTAIVLPEGTTGPLLLRAMREGEVTAIVGVPRLYEALLAAIELRVNAHARAVRLLWQGLLALSILVERSTGLRPGRLLFAPVRRAIAPRLRLLVSGGARLERDIEERLEALGWMVLSGYGLAETASLFTGNSPHARRLGSAGRPLAGGEIRIADPDAQGIGEIELHGSAITKGYLDNPDADRAAFTQDGWFRTGDLGFVDRDGFLFVTGRAKEVLVLGGGKKVMPEDLEQTYGAAAEIAEIAVLEQKGGLVALVRPDPANLRARGATNFRDGIRVILAQTAQSLPSYQRLSGFALTDQPLPRTRLGKYRRFLLPGLYARALAGGVRRPAHAPTPEEAALLRDPTAAAIWALLRGRYPDQALDLDTNLGLDLALDSFSWMELTVVLEERLGIALSEADIAAVETIRDLLHLSIARRTEVRAPPPIAPAATIETERWLTRRGLFLAAVWFVLHALNWLLMRGLFRLRVSGTEKLPATGAFVIAPSHASYLDPMAIAAALPWQRLRRLYWAGDALLLFSTPWARLFCRAMHIFPVDAAHPEVALETAARVLKAGDSAIWFAEGWRSPDGKLQRFLPGIGRLLLRSGAPAVPAYIAGAFEAWPRGRRLPRLHRITVRFGRPEPVAALRMAGTGRSDEERIAGALRQRVLILASEAGVAAEAAQALP
jgi:long-chain acyl-CoA synthetase